MNFLLVEPDFPIPAKSKNHKNFLPIGLLKIASYLRVRGDNIKLVRGIPDDLLKMAAIEDFQPDEIWVTSLFTYWAVYVKKAVTFYKDLFPDAKIVVGGIYASLIPSKEVKEFTGCDEVVKGVHKEAEKYPPAYELIENSNPHPIDYQIIHASRGCPRRCEFCGTWKIEPKFVPKKTIKDEIKFRKLVFYDNNFLNNPYVQDILEELIDLKKEKKILWCESQSGFDGRILLDKPHLAEMLKKASFRYPRIAWDWGYKDYPKIKKQIDLLVKAKYKRKDIYVFMLYNWNIPFKEMEKKRLKCWRWKVQISDCRYRPLTQLYDNYNPRIKGQTSQDYYIHEDSGWNDLLVKQFRRNVREQNICVRHDFFFYSNSFEAKIMGRDIVKTVKSLVSVKDKVKYMKENNIDFWIPNKIRYP
jgi:hypothetical protein